MSSCLPNWTFWQGKLLVHDQLIAKPLANIQLYNIDIPRARGETELGRPNGWLSIPSTSYTQWNQGEHCYSDTTIQQKSSPGIYFPTHTAVTFSKSNTPLRVQSAVVRVSKADVDQLATETMMLKEFLPKLLTPDVLSSFSTLTQREQG